MKRTKSRRIILRKLSSHIFPSITFIIIVGIPVIYLFGAVQMKYVTNQPWGAIMIQAVLPFIPLDIVKCFAAAGIAKPLRRLFPAD